APWRSLVLEFIPALRKKATTGVLPSSAAPRNLLSSYRLKIKYDERSFLGAALDGNTPVVALFLKAGMNPNTRDVHGATPLLVTAAGGRSETAELLLANGADIHAKDNRGWTPLIFAVVSGDLDLAEEMLNHGADASARG